MPQPWPDSDIATSEDLAACRAMLCGGSRSFYAASFLLPRRVHEPATALYAFCRQADDEIDLDRGSAAALERLSARLDRIYAGWPDPTPVDRALAGVVSRFQLPRALLDALLEGFAWDAAGRRYEDLSAVYDYCARVAGSVGAMMAVLMDVRSPELAARACDLGVAMQLTNIARDVGDDARAGRLYLPQQWLREEGVDPDAWLARPVYTDALGRVVRRLLQVADALYAQADEGIAGLSPHCRLGIGAARFLYAEIGREVERFGCDSVSRRAVVSCRRKASLLTSIVLSAIVPRRCPSILSLTETEFLVEAVASAAPVAAEGGLAQSVLPLARLEARAVWVLELFERLERQDRARRAAVLATGKPAAAAVRA
jgi:phytoene synthase